MDYCSRSPLRNDHENDVRHLFEDSAWLYAFCREYLFRDHTEEIAAALFPTVTPTEEPSVLEIGCGPGFYARRLARRYPASRVVGVDRSSRLIAHAQARAAVDDLANCRFLEGDVEDLSASVEAVDAVISSRLLLIVPNPSVVIAEIFRVLKPGGRLFLAEPTASFKTRLPLSAMRFVAHLFQKTRRWPLPQSVHIFAPPDFEKLVRSQPWASVSIRRHNDYQCAVCEKVGELEGHVSDQEPFPQRPNAIDSRSVVA